MSAEEEKDEKQKTNIHPFDKLMFGQHERTSKKKLENQEDETDLENVDFMELMKQIDILTSSFGHFKPLLNKVTPLLEKWIKK
ncbi:MAG: hypothetical protein IMW92_00855 [Bacillales bacterium]|nr:hypothetical protein [Bacillales bacterium]